MHLDGELALNISDRSMDFTPVDVKRIIFGAFLTGDSTNQHSGTYTKIFAESCNLCLSVIKFSIQRPNVILH